MQAVRDTRRQQYAAEVRATKLTSHSVKAHKLQLNFALFTFFAFKYFYAELLRHLCASAEVLNFNLCLYCFLFPNCAGQLR